MNVIELSGLLVAAAGIGSLIMVAITFLYNKSRDKVVDQQVNQKELNDAVDMMKEIYGQMTSDLRIQVTDLIKSDRECKAELLQAQADLHQLRYTTASHSQEIANLHAHQDAQDAKE